MMFMSSVPQTIQHVGVRYMGVGSILGRYPIHFHMNGDDSRGTLIEGVVVRDSHHHAFVAHASHGITFRDTIAFDIERSAYWWDPVKGTGSFENATNDVTYDHALAALVTGENFNGTKAIDGFSLLHGEGGTVVDSAAVAVQGNVNAAGFAWPPNDVQVFDFRDNVAHNCKVNGIFTWHNDSTVHSIRDFTAYSNRVGIDHGAYRNAYFYENIYLYGNETAIELHAAAHAGATWSNVTTRNTLSGVSMNVLHSGASTLEPVTFCNYDFDGTIEDNSNQPFDQRVRLLSTCP
jgi:hypothetical protein